MSYTMPHQVVVLAEETSYIKNGQKLLEAADEVVWLENRPGYKVITKQKWIRKKERYLFPLIY